MTGSGLLLSKTNGMSSSTASLGTVAAAAAAAGVGGGGFGEDETQLFDETVDQIKRDHIEAARKIITNSPEVLQEVEEDLEYDCERLRGFLRAAQVCLPFSAIPAPRWTNIRTAPIRSLKRFRPGQRTRSWVWASDWRAASSRAHYGIG